MSFFTELKRRNVFKVAAAYIIVGWLIMQAGDTLAPALHLPEWVNSLLAFFLLLGFPLAVFFAWAYEMTPEGIRKEKDVEKSQSITQVTSQKLNTVIIILMAAALAYFAWDKFLAGPADQAGSKAGKHAAEESSTQETVSISAPAPNKKSIAVIPFQNRSANQENSAFFSDGVHDELLTNLSRIEDLKVISRTSVMNYRDTTKNMRQIGEELGVANILEGGVQRAGDKVRINVQLIDAATDEHLWAEVYDRQLTTENIFSIQTEIARAIANALETTLSPREQELLATIPTTSLPAYDNLLMARQLFDRGNWRDLREAQKYLETAIDLDENFVDAHALLARNYYTLFSTGANPLQEIRAPWEQAIQIALSLDNNNAEAYAAQAQFLWVSGQEGAEDNFEKARQLSPHNVDILTMYGEYLRKTFSPDRALPLYVMAKELDPFSSGIFYGLARIYEAHGETEKALEQYARIREVAPANSIGYGPVAGTYIQSGNLVQGVNWLFKALEFDPDDSDLSNWVAWLYMDLGDNIRARQWLDWIDRSQAFNPMTLTGMAMLSVIEGDTSTSITYTRQALEEKLPDRWGSDSGQIRALLVWALEHKQTTAALDMVKQAHPELFVQNPLINSGNVLQAVDTAHLMQSENLSDEAAHLLEAVVEAYEKPYAVAESWVVTAKAQALALLGQEQAALDELRHQSDNGWRQSWRWQTELNPNFISLQEDPEFQAIVELLRADIAGQLDALRAMETAGEIPSPPKVEDA